MMVLTVKQPWAWAILHAGKDIENRTWARKYRGPLAIHAGAGYMKDQKLPRGVQEPENLIRSAILGVVDLVDIVETSRSRWFQGEPFYGWVLKNPRPLAKPLPCKGRLGLWSVPPGFVRKLKA